MPQKFKLQFVDEMKPYPDTILANITHKLLLFFYPPSAIKKVHIKYIVESPKLDLWNVLLFVLSILLAFPTIFLVYKQFFGRLINKSKKTQSCTKLETDASDANDPDNWLSESSVNDMGINANDDELHLENQSEVEMNDAGSSNSNADEDGNEEIAENFEDPDDTTTDTTSVEMKNGCISNCIADDDGNEEIAVNIEHPDDPTLICDIAKSMEEKVVGPIEPPQPKWKQ